MTPHSFSFAAWPHTCGRRFAACLRRSEKSIYTIRIEPKIKFLFMIFLSAVAGAATLPKRRQSGTFKRFPTNVAVWPRAALGAEALEYVQGRGGVRRRIHASSRHGRHRDGLRQRGQRRHGETYFAAWWKAIPTSTTRPTARQAIRKRICIGCFSIAWSTRIRDAIFPKISPSAGGGATSAAKCGSISTASSRILASTCIVAISRRAFDCRTAGDGCAFAAISDEPLSNRPMPFRLWPPRGDRRPSQAETKSRGDVPEEQVDRRTGARRGTFSARRGCNAGAHPAVLRRAESFRSMAAADPKDTEGLTAAAAPADNGADTVGGDPALPAFTSAPTGASAGRTDRLAAKEQQAPARLLESA